MLQEVKEEDKAKEEVNRVVYLTQERGGAGSPGLVGSLNLGRSVLDCTKDDFCDERLN